MNYRAQVAAIRRRRDRAVIEAKAALAAAVAERDSEIRRLRAEGTTLVETAAQVGCGVHTVMDVMHPENRVRYNARRAAYWKDYYQRKRAAVNN